jgi:hypothetical protein
MPPPPRLAANAAPRWGRKFALLGRGREDRAAHHAGKELPALEHPGVRRLAGRRPRRSWSAALAGTPGQGPRRRSPLRLQRLGRRWPGGEATPEKESHQPEPGTNHPRDDSRHSTPQMCQGLSPWQETNETKARLTGSWLPPRHSPDGQDDQCRKTTAPSHTA